MLQTITRPSARWECRCAEPAILLGIYATGRHVEIKCGDRFYLASGVIHATCPRCGVQHILDLTREAVSR